MRDLGTVDGDRCNFATGINSRGQVNGVSADCAFTALRAFLWEEGGPMVDLNELIPPGSDVHLEFPETINDRGEIAGTGSDPNRNKHAFLLIPCDENHPGIEDCDYSEVEESASAIRVGSPPVAQNPPTANPWAANPMMHFFGHRSMPWYRNLGVQPPPK